MRRHLTRGGVAVVMVLAIAACGGSDDIAVSSPFDEPSTSVAIADEVTDADVADADIEPVPDVATPECPPEGGTDDITQQFAAAPPFCLDPDAGYTALVETSAGDLTIELDQATAPETVNSFVFLARNNYFDDTICHRVIRDFVVQCGDPTASGTGGPGYRFADELPDDGAYEVGSIAMANSGADTNGSQFFIISGPNGAALPPLYSLFGQVVEDDLGVVTDMNALGSTDSGGVPSEEIRILDVTITQS